jgi:hypothetical protein
MRTDNRILRSVRRVCLALVVVAGSAIVAPAPTQAATPPGTFSLRATPQALSIKPGKSGVVRLTVKRGKGFKAKLTFSVQSPLAGVVATTGKVSSTGTRVTFRADTTVPPQTADVIVTATGGGQTQSATVTVVTGIGGAPAPAPPPAATPTPAPVVATTTPPVPPAAAPTTVVATTTAPATPFTLTAQTDFPKAIPGSQIRVFVDIVANPRPNVRLKLTGLPAGAIASPTEAVTNTSATFLVSFPPNIAVGEYRLTAEGVAGSSTATATTDPIEIRTTPKIQFGIGQSSSNQISQGETATVKLFAWGTAGIAPVKFSTDTSISGATITFTPIDKDGVASMTVVTTQQTPPGGKSIIIVGTGANRSISQIKYDLIVAANGKGSDFAMSAVYDEDPKNADGFLQVLPNYQTSVTVAVGPAAGSTLKPPPVTITFPKSSAYTVVPESAVTDGSANFKITFTQPNEGGVTVSVVGTAGSVVQTLALKKMRVSGRPKISLIACSGVQFFRTPGVQSKKFKIRLSPTIGMPPPEIKLARAARPDIVNWAPGAFGSVPPFEEAQIIVTAFADLLPAGRYTLGDIYAQNSRQPEGLSDPVSFSYLISNVGDADVATC